MKGLAARKSLWVLALSLAVSACGAHDGDGADSLNLSLKVTKEATAADVGLPAYPGAKPYTEGNDSSSGANIGLSTPLFGLKVAAVKLETPDAPARVGAFYRKALMKYGDVLECSRKERRSAAREDGLTCESNELDKHEVVYKAGTKSNQRVVAIESHGGGTRFSLVHVDVREDVRTDVRELVIPSAGVMGKAAVSGLVHLPCAAFRTVRPALQSWRLVRQR